jgi:hypothetical protein
MKAEQMERLQMERVPNANVVKDLSSNGVAEISRALRQLLADTFALYIKTKNFHWHMSGPHFRDYHLLLDEQAPQTTSGSFRPTQCWRNFFPTTSSSPAFSGWPTRRAMNTAISQLPA